MRDAVAALLAACAAGAAFAAGAQAPAAYTVEGDAIVQALGAQPGDAARGRAIVASRQVGLCLLCHTAPVPEERFQGNLAPDLAGVGARLSVPQLRLRVADPRRLNPDSFMPAFHGGPPPARVGALWQGKPILSGQQVEDVVAYLATLK